MNIRQKVLNCLVLFTYCPRAYSLFLTKNGVRSGYAYLLARLRIKAKAIMNNNKAQKAVDHFDKAGTKLG